MRMQFAFRQSKAKRNGFNVAICVGIIEVPVGILPADAHELCLRAKFSFNHEKSDIEAVKLIGFHSMEAGSQVSPLDITSNTLEGMLGLPLPRAVPTQELNAEFFLRPTQVAITPDGRETFAMVGFTYQTTEDALKQVYFMESPDNGDTLRPTGKLGIDWHTEHYSSDFDTSLSGEGLSAYLKTPMWGFGREPYALPGTMRPEFYNLIAERNLLLAQELAGVDTADQLKQVTSELRDTYLQTSDSTFLKFQALFLNEYKGHKTTVPLSITEIADAESNMRSFMNRFHVGDMDFNASIEKAYEEAKGQGLYRHPSATYH